MNDSVKTLLTAALLCLVVTACGCSTIHTQSSESSAIPEGSQKKTYEVPQWYSGTSCNLIFWRGLATLDPDACACFRFGPVATVLTLGYWAIDLPCSFVADTLILPYTIPKQGRMGTVQIASSHYGFK